MNRESRRKLLKSLSVSGAAGAVGVWHKPVVDAVALPVHAQTTDTTDTPVATCPEGCYTNPINNNTQSARLELLPSPVVHVYPNTTCDGVPSFTRPAVIGGTAEEAAQTLPCEVSEVEQDFFIQECVVWVCD